MSASKHPRTAKPRDADLKRNHTVEGETASYAKPQRGVDPIAINR